MPEDNGSRFVNTLLNPASLAELETIQSYHGIKTRSDVIRMLIRMEARRIASPAPSVRDIIGAFNTGHVTAEEALAAIGGHADQLS
jgi:hypothetical protein